ncbi:hypothetical protein K435DRAFT_865822 [Dendrothele bispora CBS 962.96]|uniref:F-box domain-containing protein n=1 Tax=Dendrothele bispora (strain CBS 962.96) TaxID=1314807 RepID=A0A4S8LIL5_DENBC|nr:hypothetical protein K435DRAFT_865822 [Dendrothele bispora CBS 962.96]
MDFHRLCSIAISESTRWVTAIAISADGGTVAYGCHDGLVGFYVLDTGQKYNFMVSSTITILKWDPRALVKQIYVGEDNGDLHLVLMPAPNEGVMQTKLYEAAVDVPVTAMDIVLMRDAVVLLAVGRGNVVEILRIMNDVVEERNIAPSLPADWRLEPQSRPAIPTTIKFLPNRGDGVADVMISYLAHGVHIYTLVFIDGRLSFRTSWTLPERRGIWAASADILDYERPNHSLLAVHNISDGVDMYISSPELKQYLYSAEKSLRLPIHLENNRVSRIKFSENRLLIGSSGGQLLCHLVGGGTGNERGDEDSRHQVILNSNAHEGHVQVVDVVKTDSQEVVAFAPAYVSTTMGSIQVFIRRFGERLVGRPSHVVPVEPALEPPTASIVQATDNSTAPMAQTASSATVTLPPAHGVMSLPTLGSGTTTLPELSNPVSPTAPTTTNSTDPTGLVSPPTAATTTVTPRDPTVVTPSNTILVADPPVQSRSHASNSSTGWITICVAVIAILALIIPKIEDLRRFASGESHLPQSPVLTTQRELMSTTWRELTSISPTQTKIVYLPTALPVRAGELGNTLNTETLSTMTDMSGLTTITTFTVTNFDIDSFMLQVERRYGTLLEVAGKCLAETCAPRVAESVQGSELSMRKWLAIGVSFGIVRWRSRPRPSESRDVQLNSGDIERTCESAIQPASSSPTRPSSTSLAPRIPQELQERVVKFLDDDTQSLRCCLLVCRSWVPTARYCLYECFGIEAGMIPEDDISNALKIVQEGLDDKDLDRVGNLVSPELLRSHAKIHRRLSLVGDTCEQLSHEWFLPLALSLSQFSAVRTLELHDVDWSDLLSSQAWEIFHRQSSFLSQVKFLFLGDVEMEVFSLLKRVVVAFPRLEELEIFPAYVEDYTEDLLYSINSDCSGNYSSSEDPYTNLCSPPSSLRTFIGDVSPGEFILCPLFRWLTSSSFTGLRRIELGQISRNDVLDFVRYLEVAGGALKELKIAFRVVSDAVNQKDTSRSADLDLFTSYGGVSASTGLVYLEISGLIEAGARSRFTAPSGVQFWRRLFFLLIWHQQVFPGPATLMPLIMRTKPGASDGKAGIT